ncbi:MULTISPECIES: RNA-binding cell elongation regulator Jag/EloR [Pelosinus]|uniref:RNA-binding protein KhpB n=1 Tax=Pelosinus fermentans B4 TaxID=1149862 RepID=I8RHX8_9FIRM|nr:MULTISPECIES: RNA-binding cell elongation regulator Jag/EloR [Pelosinus]EIW17585.1 single-stranded nucleic acid binding R3H domain-containing protein [Pelosinus fermentans B4]EIW23322.1 single-stranded nucleic acid binding R3H domain-containing protein [Pelosinus fermentans A11]OAM92140.1 single-stranded nucleic acid binding R3H domain-containing protein [Pelosinus fermentans DSM 17108]SDQ34635.1 spoIIIJ-associated protein [Pelosinus fermentans]
MTSVDMTGKTVEEAVRLALNELQVGEDRIEYEVLEAPSKGLFGFIGSKPAKVRVTIKPIDPVQVAHEFLKTVFDLMKLEVQIERVGKEDSIGFNIRGNDLGILIGKHGQTLDALQYLTNLTANRDIDGKVRIILDVEDYRQRRTDTLNRLAARLADSVKRRGEKVVLEPMSPNERKIIHMALQDDQRIITYSEGEEPYRKIVIALKR